LIWLILIPVLFIIAIIIYLYLKGGGGSSMEGIPFTFTNSWGEYQAEFFIREDTPVPTVVVVVIHGLLANYGYYDWIIQRLVDAGYAVVGFNVPNNFSLEPKQWSEGASSCIDYITSTEPFKSMVDANRIGAIGHSMGGLGTVWLLADDPRVKTGVPLSAAVSVFMGGDVLPKPDPTSITRPVQFHHGTIDRLCPYDGALEYYEQIPGSNKEFVTFEDVGHVEFIDTDVPFTLEIKMYPNYYREEFNRRSLIGSEEVHQKSGDNFMEWFNRYLNGGGNGPPSPPTPEGLGVSLTGAAITGVILTVLALL